VQETQSLQNEIRLEIKIFQILFLRLDGKKSVIYTSRKYFYNVRQSNIYFVLSILLMVFATGKIRIIFLFVFSSFYRKK
jgi:hypothetical protein